MGWEGGNQRGGSHYEVALARGSALYPHGFLPRAMDSRIGSERVWRENHVTEDHSPSVLGFSAVAASRPAWADARIHPFIIGRSSSTTEYSVTTPCRLGRHFPRAEREHCPVFGVNAIALGGPTVDVNSSWVVMRV